MQPQMRVLDALAISGGFTPFAGKTRVKIIRGHGSHAGGVHLRLRRASSTARTWRRTSCCCPETRSLFPKNARSGASLAARRSSVLRWRSPRARGRRPSCSPHLLGRAGLRLEHLLRRQHEPDRQRDRRSSGRRSASRTSARSAHANLYGLALESHLLGGERAQRRRPRLRRRLSTARILPRTDALRERQLPAARAARRDPRRRHRDDHGAGGPAFRARAVITARPARRGQRAPTSTSRRASSACARSSRRARKLDDLRRPVLGRLPRRATSGLEHLRDRTAGSARVDPHHDP